MEKNNTEANTHEEIRWGGILNEFFWICSGANRKILRQCPTDYSKYFGIGGTIFFTAAMAMLSGGYAFYTIFDNQTIALFFGLFWGLLILNLDRLMVTTMYSDGKHTISKDELLGGLPRLILAIFIGVIISVPIEMKIFDDKIQSQLLIDQGNTIKIIMEENKFLYNERDSISNQKRTYENQLNELTAGKGDGYTSSITSKENELSEAEDQLYNETNGTGITGIRGYGPAAKQLQDKVDRLKKELDKLRKDKENAKPDLEIQKRNLQNNIEKLNLQLEEINKKISDFETRMANAANALSGFTARLKALSEVTDFSNNLTLFIARIMIMLLFITIEVIPTFFKMMIASGPYDEIVKEEYERKKAQSILTVSQINDSVNTQIQIAVAKNKDKLEAEIAANKEILSRIAVIQTELLHTAIEEWRKEELKKIKANPSNYIKSNTTQH